MILHPGILALTCGSIVVLLMLLYASGLALKILFRWDFSSSSENQLNLERKSYLISTLVNYALGFEVFSLVLFVFTLEEIHPLFFGAMCATGSLNANPLGWLALHAKIAGFFAAALWIACNALDNRAEDYPLVRVKYFALLLITPLLGGQFYLQTTYFLGLRPEVITSCCGALFSSAGGGIAAELAGLPVKPMMAAFYATALSYLGCALACLKWPQAALRYLLLLLAVSFFPLSLAAIVSFISVYIYELPTHHCPFDILQHHYRFIGYPLYFSLFGGTLFGLLPGLFHGGIRFPSLQPQLRHIERKWLLLSILFTLTFLLLATWPILFGNYRLTSTPSFF